MTNHIHVAERPDVKPGTVAYYHDNDRIDNWMEKNAPDDRPQAGTDILTCDVELAPGVVLSAAAWGNHIFVQNGSPGRHGNGMSWHLWAQGSNQVKVDPFIQAEILGDAFFHGAQVPTRAYLQHQAQERRHRPMFGGPRTLPEFTGQKYKDGYDEYNEDGRYHSDGPKLPWLYLKIRVTADDAEPVEGLIRFPWPKHGRATLNGDPDQPRVDVVSVFHGQERPRPAEYLVPFTMGQGNSRTHRNPLEVLVRHLRYSEITPDDPMIWWDRFLRNAPLATHSRAFDERRVKGVKNRKAIKAMLEKLRTDEPTLMQFLNWLHDGRTKERQCNNALLSAFLQSCDGKYAALVKGLKGAMDWATAELHPDSYYWSHRPGHEADFQATRLICLELPGAKDKVREQEAKADYSKRKSAGGKADGLGVTEDRWPKLRKAIEKGDVPITVFRNPDKQPVNLEFDIWEKALARKGWAEEIAAIAQSASGRSTYEKDVTPYLAFLFKIEGYLNKHTEGRRKWKAIPKFVKSQWELEMDDAQDGTTKRRSAFTPVADNEARTITVPYIAVSVSGVRTQWCYSRHYYVFEEGFTDPVSMGIVTRDLEPKLNGRDDYGLMYFTLTGTATARGYPTFLIIFERLQAGTRVHFHRVHPCRRKDGQWRPAVGLVEACYQYMAGNVPAERVGCQQGDMIYIPHPNNPITAKAKVEDPQVGPALVFESHAMIPKADGALLRLYISTAKTPRNRLGFIEVPEGGMRIQHPEHDDIDHVDPGWYEVRRCRSWEANPQAIWSLTID